ncbi:AbiH family protein [Anaerosporobacter faecicola]|uniref:AbiH family protein n=1 Tax=Anaerosporobacter faecicola TaxID=2718714 RepID=UPI00143B79BC|nr:AbiH family protein [Anaerosporobacter faecicola]
MNDVLIIGNGFDLYHKLPTRYTDFLFLVKNWGEFYTLYTEQLAKTTDMKRETKQEQFNVSVDEYGKLTKEALEDFANHAMCLDIENMSILGDIISRNVWIKYFIETGYSADGWIDFEAEIEKLLTLIEDFCTSEVFRCKGKIMSQVINPIMYKAIKCVMENTKALPLNVGLYAQSDIDKITYGDTKNQLLAELKNELNDLIRALTIYMREFVGNIKVPCFSQQIKELKNINLLNFNYTYTYKSVYGDVNSNHQVHGSLTNDDIVLGVSDNAFNNLDYVYFQKYFQRIQKKTGAYYKSWIPKEFTALEDAPIKVYILGHSLGMTDKEILKDFFFEGNVSEITIFYHNLHAYEQLVISLIDMFGKDFVIEQTGIERIKFVELKPAVVE